MPQKKYIGPGKYETPYLNPNKRSVEGQQKSESTAKVNNGRIAKPKLTAEEAELVERSRNPMPAPKMAPLAPKAMPMSSPMKSKIHNKLSPSDSAFVTRMRKR